jgi:acyl dehydratase
MPQTPDEGPEKYETVADVPVGETIAFGSYEVTGEEIQTFAEQYDPQPFHVDEEAAAASPFGGIIASGWHTAAMTERMLVEHVLNESGAMGSPGVNDLRWRRPVRPGDVLTVELTFDETEDWDDDRGLVRATMRTLNDEGEAVMTMEVLVLFPQAT